MRFKVDENLPFEIAEHLQSLGHDTDTVLEEGLAGQADPVVLSSARSRDRILLTLDKGIAMLSGTQRKCTRASFSSGPDPRVAARCSLSCWSACQR